MLVACLDVSAHPTLSGLRAITRARRAAWSLSIRCQGFGSLDSLVLESSHNFIPG